MLLRDTVFPLLTSRTLNRTGVLAVALGAYSVLPILKEYTQYHDLAEMPSDMHAALSLVLGALLVFRTNSSYSRWWEARTLWGALVNSSRNLSVKLASLVELTDEDKLFLQGRIAEFPRRLMVHLRMPTQSTDHPTSTNCVHRPLAVVQQLYRWVHHKRQQGLIDGDELRVIDCELAKLLDICGGCERIARTPFVRSYRIFARQCVILFLLSFPWGVAADFQWWTIPLTMIISYFMIGMEIVSEHVEEPFGHDEDDLDLEGLCETIERSVTSVFTS